MKVINKHSRSSLAEGRTSGIGFAWAEKKEDNYITINPVSPCKDYLNDQCAVENGYKEFTVYGLQSNKRNLFKKCGYLVIRACDSEMNEQTNNTLDTNVLKIKKLLEKNYDKIKLVLNSIENKFTKEKTEIYKANDDYYVIKVPKIWTINGPMISFYSLIVRNAIYGAVNFDDLVLNRKFYSADYNFIPYAVYFYYLIKNGFIPEINYQDEKFKLTPTAVHNYGIVEYSKDYLK